MALVLSACAGLIAFVAAQLDARPPEALGVLAVAPPPGPGPDLVEDALALRREIAGRRAGVLDGDRLRVRMSGPPSTSLAELDLAFERARADFFAGDHEASVRALRGIVDDLERAPESAETLRQWTRAVLRLAKSETDLGRPDVSRALLERLVRAVPDAQVDPELYPARFIQQVEQARAGVRAEPTRVLRVSASADGATVYLNGRDVGPAPVELVVPRGRHRVGGAAGAARVRPVAIDLQDGDQAVLLDFSVPEALRPALGPGLAVADVDRPRIIAASGSYLGLTEMAVVGHETDRAASFLVGALYDVRRGILIREGRVRKGSAGGVEALAEFLVTGTATAQVERLDEKGRPVSATIPGLTATESSRPPKPQALGWVTLGTGLAALAFTTYAAIETGQASSSYAHARDLQAAGLTTYEDVAQYNQAVAEGDTAKRRAAAGWIAAGTCIVVTGVVGYLNHRRTGDVGPFRF